MKKKVLVALPERDNEYQRLQTIDARVTSSRWGLDLEVVYANGEPAVQLQQLAGRIGGADPPHAVVVEPVGPGDGLEDAARAAAAARLGWAVLNCTCDHIQRLRRENAGVAIFAVGSDQLEIGRIQGRQLRTLLPAGGTALYINGPEGAPAARERLQGLRETLEGSGVTLIILAGRWTEESAETSVRSWLASRAPSTRIAAVAGQDDSMARGARRVLEAATGGAAAWAGVPFVGIDGVPAVGQRLVDTGQLTATIVMPSNTGPAIDNLARWMDAGTVPPELVRVPVRSYPAEPELASRGAGPPPA